MFQPHPSCILTEHFRQKPYQGADPRSARFLFVGLDANYAADVESSPIFPRVIEYHRDGPAFWRNSGVHHPFLLPEYKGDGRRYHRTFAKIGFQPSRADQISFVELLDRPTVGQSTLVARDLGPQHLSHLHRVIFDGAAQFIFLSAGVQRLLVASGSFPRLSTVRRHQGALRVLYEDDCQAIFLHLHFSNYGKFELQLQAEAEEIFALLADSVKKGSLLVKW